MRAKITVKINFVRYICLKFVNVCHNHWEWNLVCLKEALTSSVQEHRKKHRGGGKVQNGDCDCLFLL